MSENAISQLHQLLDNLGCDKKRCISDAADQGLSGSFGWIVKVQFQDGRALKGTGQGNSKPIAKRAAYEDALAQLRDAHPDLLLNWDELKVEAQAGDALIKLCIYLAVDIRQAGDKSLVLQKLERDEFLTKVFDQWQQEGDSALSILGTNLGKKRKATMVEALIWRRFGEGIIDSGVKAKLHMLRELLERSQS